MRWIRQRTLVHPAEGPADGHGRVFAGAAESHSFRLKARMQDSKLRVEATNFFDAFVSAFESFDGDEVAR